MINFYESKPIKKYGIAFLIYLIAFGLRLLILPISSGLGYVTFYPAMEIAALLCGPGPCLFSVLLGSVTGLLLFNNISMLPFFIFICAGCFMAYVVSIMQKNNIKLNDTVVHLQDALSTLKLINDQLEESVKQRDIFMSTMSHELRTPLNAILGFSDLMVGEVFGDISPKYKQYAGNINESGKVLLQFINDILNYRKIISVGLDIDQEIIALDMIQEVVSAVTNTKTIAYELNSSNILVDVKTFRQIITNIFSNCVKYGGDLIIIKSYDQDDKVVIEIYDNGSGIPDIKMKNLYVPFYTCDKHLSNNSTGLGLPLVKKLIELNDGNIEITNNNGALVKLFFMKA